MNNHNPTFEERTLFAPPKTLPAADLQKLLDSSLDVVCSIDAEGRFIYVNDATRKVWGYEPEELIGRSYMDMVHPEDHCKTRAISEAIIAGKKVTYFENRYYRKDGSIVPIIWSAKWDEQDKVLYGVAKDATERNEVGDKEIQSQKKLANILETIKDGFFSVDRNWTVTYWNNKAEEILQMKRSDILGKNLWDVYQDAIPLRFYKEYHRALNEDTNVQFEEFFPPLNSWFEVNVSPSEEGLLVFFKNINKKKQKEAERKEYEKRIQDQNQMMVDVLEQMQDGFITVTLKGTIIYWNNAAEKITGLSREATLGKSFWNLYPGIEQTPFFKVYQRLLQTPTPVFEEAFSPYSKKWIQLHAYKADKGISVFFRDVTERRKAEEELQLLNERFSVAAKSDALYDWDICKEQLYWGEGLYSIFGYQAHELQIDDWKECLHPNKAEAVCKSLYDVMEDADASKWEAEYQFKRKDGKYCFVHELGHIIRDENGKAVRMVGRIQDISDRKNAEDKIRSKNLELYNLYRELRFITDSVPQLVWASEPNGYASFVNKGWVEYTGLTYEQTIGNGWAAVLHPDDAAEVFEKWQQSLATGKIFDAEHRLRRHDGEYRWFVGRGIPMRDRNGNIIKWYGTSTDIHEQKINEEELKKINERFALVSKATQDAIWDWDLATDHLWWNDGFTSLFGYKENEIEPSLDAWSALVHPEDRDRVCESLATAVNSRQKQWSEEYRFKKADGTYAFVYDRGYVSCDAEGKPYRMIGSMQDITQQKNAADELQRLSIIAKEMHNAVVVQDKDRRVLWVNNAFVQISGYTADECLGKLITEICDGPETDPNVVNYVQQKVQSGEAIRIETLNYKKNGEAYWSDVSCQPIFNGDGEIVQYFSIATDITARKHLEQKLIKEQKERQIKIAAATLKAQESERAAVSQELHDNVNQVLTTVKLYVEMCRDGFGDTKEMMEKCIRLLQESINEIRSLSKRLSAPSLGKIKLSDSVKELVEAVKATKKIYINLNTENINCVEVSQEVHLAIYRILQEHLTNVLKHAEATTVDVKLELMVGHIIMTVKDDGKGFDLNKKSTGIGITNMMTRAESLKGTFQIDSAPEQGCELMVSIPL